MEKREGLRVKEMVRKEGRVNGGGEKMGRVKGGKEGRVKGGGKRGKG